MSNTNSENDTQLQQQINHDLPLKSSLQLFVHALPLLIVRR